MATQSGKASTAKGRTASKTPAADAKKDEAAKVNPLADKQGRLPYPGLQVDKEGVPTATLKEIPADFSSKKHQALKAKNFENEHDWFEFRAQIADRQAAMYRKRAEESKATGGKNGAKMKKFLAMKNRYETMMQELEGEGVDLEELFSKIAPSDEGDEGEGDEGEE